MKKHMKSTMDLSKTLCGIKIKPEFELVENSVDYVFVDEVTCENCIKIINAGRSK